MLAGCASLPGDIQCCVGGDTPCTYNQAQGLCDDETKCASSGGTVYASSSGANGCQALAANVVRFISILFVFEKYMLITNWHYLKIEMLYQSNRCYN